jgi:hypothetical protein
MLSRVSVRHRTVLFLYLCYVLWVQNNGERWKELCKQACIEQDPAKLSELVTEINRLLQEKADRLKALRKNKLCSE